ncbi:MAG: Dicer-like protein 1 [Thelocarpon superellum]|nr:MAG: Dicer-like protein 1 [Thelocarpon superellum]
MLPEGKVEATLTSEGSDDGGINPPHSSQSTADCRRLQNDKFSQWFSRRAGHDLKGGPKGSTKDLDVDARSIKYLIGKQESAVIVTDPREYQLELFERAKERNTIAVLDTGTHCSGKTLIAVLLLKHILDRELEDRGSGKDHRIAFFLVDSVTLVFQQHAVLECNLDQPIDRFCGDMGCDLWNKATWDKHFADNMVIVCTAEVLYQCLMHSFITMAQINLLVFDEAHHAKKNHSYARIIKDFYLSLPDTGLRPKIFGMTASPVDAKVDVVQAAKDLEALLDCQIATTSDMSLLQQFVHRPQEQMGAYDKLLPPFETPLYRGLHKLLGSVNLLSRAFLDALAASSELGPWCSDHLWSLTLTEDGVRKIERKAERDFEGHMSGEPSSVLEHDLYRLGEARDFIDQHAREPRPTLDDLSSKVLWLQKFLAQRYSEAGTDKCIIFVQKRRTARLLASLFVHASVGTPHLRVGLLMGTVSAGVNDLQISFRDQVLTLTKFRNGTLNCLSVMRRFCESLPADRRLHGANDDLELATWNERGFRVYVEKETGAKLTYGSSLAVLANFVSSLNMTNESFAKPDYVVTREREAFRCEVLLPETSPVRSAIGQTSARRAIAKRSAAFEACLMLRQRSFLDKYLLPTYRKQLPIMRNALLALHTKTGQVYDQKTKPDLWARSVDNVPAVLFLTVLELARSEGLDRPHQPLALLTRTLLPAFPAFPVYFRSGAKSEVVSNRASSISMTREKLDLVNTFTLRIFLDLFNKEYENDVARMPYWLAPVQFNPANEAYEIEWDTISVVQENQCLQWRDVTSTDFWNDKFIVDPFDGGTRYFSEAVSPDHAPYDPVPSGVPLRKNMENILQYSVSFWRKTRERAIWRDDQPVIKAHMVMHRHNWLDEPSEEEKKTSTECYICPEPLRVSALPTEVVAMAYLFPAIIFRLESYMIGLELFDQLHLEVRAELALEAITKDSDNTEEHREAQVQFQRGMGRNYERLEFIGDCFLKMATSIALYTENPDNDEFEYHVKRMVLICNKNLLNTATSRKIYEYVRSEAFNRRVWYPEEPKLLRGKKGSKGMRQHRLGDKTLADICEAVIGAALVSHHESGNLDPAVRAVTEMVNGKSHTMTSWKEYYARYKKPAFQTASATYSQLDLAKQVEKKYGYHFRDPRLLRSAFIHPSYPFSWEHVPCYQRLEFLGDALLDMACVNFLYYRFPDRDPQWLTEHKMAMVSNRFLGALCVRLGFHKHLRYNSSALERQIRDYVTEIQEAEMQADGAPDYWISAKASPKVLPDIVEAYLGAIFVDSCYEYAVVERFFQMHIQPYFEDMQVYDSFANSHPVVCMYLTLSSPLSKSGKGI